MPNILGFFTQLLPHSVPPFKHVNPLTAGAAYIRVFIFYQQIKYQILNMLKIKFDINQQVLKRVKTSTLSNQNTFHSLEVVDRVSETQLQVGGFKLNNLAGKGLKPHDASTHKFCITQE